MSFGSFLQWLSETGFSMWLRGSVWAEPIFETIHVLTLTVFLGFTVLLDLRLLGISMRRRRASDVIGQLNPWVMGSFAVMIVTGTLLFAGDPVAFYSTVFFKLKMLLLVLALINVMVFNWTAGRKIAEWDENPDSPGGAKAAAIISLVLWVAIIAAGRAIAYVLPPP
jgi:energy-coupling factor transporter transmembrane protein EcfT